MFIRFANVSVILLGAPSSMYFWLNWTLEFPKKLLKWSETNSTVVGQFIKKWSIVSLGAGRSLDLVQNVHAADTSSEKCDILLLNFK